MRYIIVTLALALIIFWVVRAARGRGPDQQLPKDDAQKVRPPTPQGQAQPQVQVQDMVSCAHCGLHLPKAEAIAGKKPGDGALYCSTEHLHRAEP